MIEQNKKLIERKIEYNESCCSNTGCCGSKTPIKRSTPKLGRNSPCPCGSGRKFKKCCG